MGYGPVEKLDMDVFEERRVGSQGLAGSKDVEILMEEG